MTCRSTILCLLASCAICACKGVPDHVIPPEEMAELMADRHVADAVVDYNPQEWRTDSQRIMLRDAVYARYGVTVHDVDTSLDWYGHNIAKYMDVYDRTIEILEARVANSDTRLRTEQALSIAGDSVDVWGGSRFYAIEAMSPSRNITFSIGSDENREKGDYYTWRGKFVNHPGLSTWTIVAEYADSTMEYVVEKANGSGWHDLTLQTDSTREVSRIYGSLMLSQQDKGPVWLDSVSLVRNHINADKYSLRYRQRVIRK